MTAASMRESALVELRSFAVLSVYLWICFGALVLYKSAILQAEGIAFMPLGFAALKAIVSAKFLLLGNFLPIAKWRAGERLILAMLRKTLLLLILLVALTLIEEAVLAVIHGHPASEALGQVAGKSLYQVAASLLIMLLILFPYVGFRTLGEALGVENLFALLLQRAEVDAAGKD